MAAYLRVKVVATCVVLLQSILATFAFGVGINDDLRLNVGVEGDNGFEEVRHRVRRGVLPEEQRVNGMPGGVGGGGGGEMAMNVQQRAAGAAVAGIDRYVRRGDQRMPVNAAPQGQQEGVALDMQNAFQQPVAGGMQGQRWQGQAGAQAPGLPQIQQNNAQEDLQNRNRQQQQPLQPQQNRAQKPVARPGAMKPIRIANHPACESDVKRMCARSGNNFAVLDCLQKGENDISPVCNHFLWNYKMNLTMDYRFDNAASEVCREDLRKFKDCVGMEPGKGLILPCLFDHTEDIAHTQCTQYLSRMKEITFSDFRLITGFYASCQGDIAKYMCGVVNENGPGSNTLPHTQGGTIHCLERNVQKLEEQCKLQILRVAELSSNDYHEDRALFFACREDRERLCSSEVSGQGRVYKCLNKNKFHKEMSEECKEKLTTRQKVVAQDYKVNFRLQRKCKEEIERAQCTMGELRTKEMKLATILLCLEQAAKQEDFTISGDCQAELTDTRKEILSDYMINPELMQNCAREIETECKGIRREGKTIHCLMGLAKKGQISKKCKKELGNLVEEADAGSDYKIDPALHKACKPVKDALCGKKTDAEILSCLMENIDDDQMKDECAERLLEIQYFISRNFKLDPVLFKNCQSDAQILCYAQRWDGNEETPSGLVFACLHRHLHDPDTPLQPRCADQIHRVLRQRAVSVHLNPRIEEECRVDLGAYCTDRTKRGEELQCLQENMQELKESCKLAVGNFTVEEAEDVQMNRKLIAACAPMLRKFCQEKLKAKKVDEGEALRCLIEHKNDDEMEAKCQASIEHFQLIQLKDYRFGFKFKESCRKDVIKLCKGSRDKSSIIKCLSSKVRDSVMKGEAPPVDDECRKQLKFELLQRDENIDLDPELKEACMREVRMLCPQVAQGNARVLECLRSHQEDLDNECHKKVFNREKEMASKPDIDYALMHSCKKSIKTKCKDSSPETLVDCLKSHKDDPDMEPRCKTVLTKRQIERNSNIQLNPTLRKACKMDVTKFCHEVYKNPETADGGDSEDTEGLVIQCLRKEFQKRQSKLSPTCEKHIGSLIKEGAQDYRLDPMLAKWCSTAIREKCSEEMMNPGTGQVEECLKSNLRSITDGRCQQQVIQLFREGLADVHVDPLLYKACALDIKHYCVGIPQGQGQQMSCLLEALEDKTVRLQGDCHRMLTERKEMWEYAAQVAPVEGLLDIYTQIRNSPSHNYFMLIFVSFIGILFIFGLCCGRATKRVRQEVKNK